MKIVIAGAGEVGYNLIERLSKEPVQLFVVDTNPVVLKRLQDQFGVTTDLSNVVDSRFLSRSHLKDADLFLAITNSDETNMIACKIASAAGVGKTVCRIRTVHLEGAKKAESLQSLGIDHIINPVELVADELFKGVMTPNLIESHAFDEGRLFLYGYRIQTYCQFFNQTVEEVKGQLEPYGILPALLLRQGRCFLPKLAQRLEEHDVLYFLCPLQKHTTLREIMGYARAAAKKKRVMINGGGHIGFRLAKRLEETHHQVKVIERDAFRSQNIAGRLSKALVLHFDGTELKSLKSEGLTDTDFFLSVTSSEQINLTACLLAKVNSHARAICLVMQQEWLPIVEEGTLIDRAVSPRILTARHLKRFIQGDRVESSFTVAHTEILQIHLKDDCPLLGKTLAQLDLGDASAVGLVAREGQYHSPSSNFKLQNQDLVLLLVHRLDRAKVLELFGRTS